MENKLNNFISLKKELSSNDRIQAPSLNMSSPTNQLGIDYVQRKYKVQLNDNGIFFYSDISLGINISWNLKKSFAEEIGMNENVAGKILIHNPGTAICDSNDGYWKNIFWFEESKTELNEKLKNFVPFDLADGFYCVTGFMKELQPDGTYKLGDQMYLNNENKELIPHPFSFEDYLEFIIKTKGYNYFLNYYNRPNSSEFLQFMEIMPKIFDDFDKDYFVRLSKRE